MQPCVPPFDNQFSTRSNLEAESVCYFYLCGPAAIVATLAASVADGSRTTKLEAR